MSLNIINMNIIKNQQKGNMYSVQSGIASALRKLNRDENQ